MADIITIGEDPKLEHAGAGDDPLDQVDLRLLDVGNDHLDLVEAVLPNGDFLLAAWIHPATDRSDELVHGDRGRLGHHVVVDFERVGRAAAARLPHGHAVELRSGERRQKSLASPLVGRCQPHRHAPSSAAADAPLRALLRRGHALDPPHRVIDAGSRLLGVVDLVDQDQASFEVDAQPRRPAQPADHRAGGEGHEHGGNATPHVGRPQPARDQSGHERGNGERQQHDAPERPTLPPPGQGLGRNRRGRRRDGRRDLGQKTKCDARHVHTCGLVPCVVR